MCQCSEGVLHVKSPWSEHPHAEILAIDTLLAEATEGVALVITSEDSSGENIAGIIQSDQPAIAGDGVRFIRDVVAAVCAEIGALGAKVEVPVIRATFS